MLYGIHVLIILISFVIGNGPDKPFMLPFTKEPERTLAVREFSLENRYRNSFVNEVFKDNILLTVDYLTGAKIDPKKIDWTRYDEPFDHKVILNPGETFAFHDDVLPNYEGKVNKTSNAHFNSVEGFRFSGNLVGDGVCHLASLLYWAAKDAGLNAVAPTRHDFANIPEVPKEFGVSIYAYPGKQTKDQVQNLYITNNKEQKIAFEFIYDGENLKIQVNEIL